MAKPGRLAELEKEKGRLDRVIPPLVNRLGVVEAARKLKISSATISTWLKDNGYVSSTTWGKANMPGEAADIEAAHDRVNLVRQAEGLPSIEEEVESW